MDISIARVRQIPAVLAAAVNADLESLTPVELIELHRSLAETQRYLDLFKAQLTTTAARKEAHRVTGAASMNALVAQEAGVSRKQANHQVRLAEQIDTSPVLREQMVKPGMSTAKAAIIARAVDELPSDVDPAGRARVEEHLAQTAPQMSVEQLRRKARRATEVLDVRLADKIENQQLKAEETGQQHAASFWMSQPDETGMVTGGFEIDGFTADILRSTLDSLTSPRKLNNQPELTGAAYRRRQGAAFVEVLRHLPTDQFGNHGGVAATLVVTISEDSLRERTDAAGTTEHGTRISAGQLRSIACNAGILPAVIDTRSQLLDLGHTRRLHSAAQRIALANRDQGCAFPGCDRPPGWCETHHINPWSNGGPTTIDNGVLLCGTHHRQIHNSDWEVRLGHDRRPEFIPPRHLDPERKPRRNHIYQPQIA